MKAAHFILLSWKWAYYITTKISSLGYAYLCSTSPLYCKIGGKLFGDRKYFHRGRSGRPSTTQQIIKEVTHMFHVNFSFSFRTPSCRLKLLLRKVHWHFRTGFNPCPYELQNLRALNGTGERTWLSIAEKFSYHLKEYFRSLSRIVTSDEYIFQVNHVIDNQCENSGHWSLVRYNPIIMNSPGVVNWHI